MSCYFGDYTEIEEWIAEGRVDCGFLRLPTVPDFETIFLYQDDLRVILPENHPLAECDVFPVAALCKSLLCYSKRCKSGSFGNI